MHTTYGTLGTHDYTSDINCPYDRLIVLLENVNRLRFKSSRRLMGIRGKTPNDRLMAEK